MSDNTKDMTANEAENTQEQDFSSFLTAEDEFRLEMEKYIPEFVQRLNNDTLEADQSFIDRSLELMELGKAAGIDMQEYITQFCKENGMIK